MSRPRALHDRTLPARTRRVSFRVTAEEYQALEEAARGAGHSVSGHIRDAFAQLLHETGRRRHSARPTEAAEATAQSVTLLGRIYANLQAMQTWAAAHQDKAHAVMLCAHLVAVERALAQVARALEGGRHDRGVFEARPGQG